MVSHPITKPSRRNHRLCENLRILLSGFYATVGCHPTRTTDFEKYKDGPEKYLSQLEGIISSNLIGQGRVVALGELGLGMFACNLESMT